MSQKKNFVLRLSPEMFSELEKWANQEFRSVNGQIEFLLFQAIASRKKNQASKEKRTPDENENQV